MKKELRKLFLTQAFFGVCILIGTVIAKPKIETQGLSFWLTFSLLTCAILVLISLSLFLRQLSLKKQPVNVPDVDERTFDNMKNVMLWHYVIVLSLFSLIVFTLLFFGIKMISTTWLLLATLLAWLSLMVSFWVAKKS